MHNTLTCLILIINYSYLNYIIILVLNNHLLYTYEYNSRGFLVLSIKNVVSYRIKTKKTLLHRRIEEFIPRPAASHGKASCIA